MKELKKIVLGRAKKEELQNRIIKQFKAFGLDNSIKTFDGKTDELGYTTARMIPVDRDSINSSKK